MSEYKYYYNNCILRTSEGKTERYDGNGKWVECPFNPADAMNFHSDKWDEGDTVEITKEELPHLMQFYEDKK